MEENIPPKSDMPQTSASNKQNIRRGILYIVLVMVILAVAGIITRNYWLLYLNAVIVFFIIYFTIGAVCAKKYQPALFVHCNPYKYYRYLRICRALFFFVRFNKNDYKTELAIGLRNKGEFYKAKKILLSIDIDKLSTAELLVLYYNNLCDLLTLLNDYEAAREAVEKGFSALSKITDERVYEIWKRYLAGNQTFLRMCGGDISGCEETFTADLEKADNEYKKIESHTNLGKYYLLTKQYDKALLHFEYIVGHGNKLFHVKEAKKHIAEM